MKYVKKIIILGFITFCVFTFNCKKSNGVVETTPDTKDKISRFRVDTTNYNYIVTSTMTAETIANEIIGYWVLDSNVFYMSDSITDVTRYGKNIPTFTDQNTLLKNEDKNLNSIVVDTFNTNITSKLRVGKGLFYLNHISLNDTFNITRTNFQWFIFVFNNDAVSLRSIGNISGTIKRLKNNLLILNHDGGGSGKQKNGLWSFCHRKN